MDRTPIHIVIATGGSGGHVIPAEVLAEKLIEKQCQITLMGHGLSENQFLKNRSHYKTQDIPSHVPSLKRIVQFGWHTSKGLLKALRFLNQNKPSVVIGFGSFHSFPVLLAARILKIPIVLYESNTKMGKVISLFSKKAKLLASPFDVFSHMPNFKQVEPLLKVSSDRLDREHALNEYGLDFDKKTLLIMGGSQGSRFFNHTLLAQVLRDLNPSVWQVIHLVGHKDSQERIQKLYEEKGFKVHTQAFEKHMARAYSAADVVLCRSGATTLFELSKQKLPAILVPYPHSKDDHQRHNADNFLKTHQGCSVEESYWNEVQLDHLLQQVLQIEANEGKLNLQRAQMLLHEKVLELCQSR